MATNVYDIINIILAGGLLGLLGQGIRMAIGLKKLSDSNLGKPVNEKTEIDSARLITSLFIGFVAGALYLIIKDTDNIGKQEFIFSVVAAGYSGTDFIEGLFNTYISKISTSSDPVKTSSSEKTSPPSPSGDLPNAPSFASSQRDDEPTTHL